MATVDLKEAYFSVPISENSKRFLRFIFDEKLYQFNVLPYGLCTAPFVFTKLLKPVNTYLRNKNILMSCYLDDSIFFNKDKNTCRQDVVFACKLLKGLGFVVNFEKSVLEPNKTCKYLGFLLNSRNLTLSVPKEKQQNILEKIKSFQKKTL